MRQSLSAAHLVGKPAMRRITLWLIVLWVAAGQTPSGLADTIVPVVDPATGNQEWRVFDSASGHHYLSVVQTPSGAIAVRPHPGDDPNGWGSTPYINVHQQGGLVGGQVDNVVSLGSSIRLSASGPVATLSGTNGQWTSSWRFSYDKSVRTAWGSGETMVSLDESLAVRGADLTVVHIASNRLRDVPLVGGGFGNTGDMSVMHVISPTWAYSWDPLVQGTSYPQDLAARLTVTMVGEHNRVDGEALRLGRIEPAYKPTVAIGIEAVTPGMSMISGGSFDELQERNPFADNIAGLAVVRHQDFAGLELEFAYFYESVPEPGTATLAMIEFALILTVPPMHRRFR